MTTIPASVKAQLDSDWTGAGGVEPTYYLQEVDFRTPPPLGEDSVWIMSKSLNTDGSDVVNDTFVNEKHVLTLIVNTAKISGGADRLKELSDEVVRILNATAITDITYQRMRGRNRELTQNQGIWVYQEVIVYDLQEQMKSGTAAYGAGAGPSLTQDNIEDLLMWESANAAWVPCSYAIDNTPNTTQNTGSKITNSTTDNNQWLWQLLLPPVKGGLKLYVSGTRIVITDADANNKIDQRILYGVEHTGGSTLDFNGGDLTASGQHQDTFTAIDCSSFDSVALVLVTVIDTIRALDVGAVTLRCYYAT